MSAEQRCAIKFGVLLKKTPSETTRLLKEAFRKEMLGDSTIWWWHKAFVDGSWMHVILNGLPSEEFLETILVKWAKQMERCLASYSQYFEKERITKEETESKDNESIMDDE